VNSNWPAIRKEIRRSRNHESVSRKIWPQVLQRLNPAGDKTEYRSNNLEAIKERKVL